MVVVVDDVLAAVVDVVVVIVDLGLPFFFSLLRLFPISLSRNPSPSQSPLPLWTEPDLRGPKLVGNGARLGWENLETEHLVRVPVWPN